MDIASYIQDLLWEYECVIIPGFGGILASYRPAEMVLSEHTLYPPSKSLAFNEYLASNDGLLVNYIQQKEQISYTEASEKLDAWVKKTKSLLSDNEEIYLPLIGRFHRDIEKKLRFQPDTSVNYLPSSYGLRKVIAEPVLRSKSTDTIDIREPHRASYDLPRANKKWAMAAIIILFLALGTVMNLMYQGVNVKPLNLNAASVLGFLEHFEKPTEVKPELKTSINKDLPTLGKHNAVIIHTEQPSSVESTNTQVANTPLTSETTPTIVEETHTSTQSSTAPKYYVIIGAFQKRSNFQNAEAYLKSKHAAEDIYEDTSLEKKRIGFYAGDNYQQACQKLSEARKDQQDYWLLMKR